MSSCPSCRATLRPDEPLWVVWARFVGTSEPWQSKPRCRACAAKKNDQLIREAVVLAGGVREAVR